MEVRKKDLLKCPSIKFNVPEGPETFSGDERAPPAGIQELNQKSANPTVWSEWKCVKKTCSTEDGFTLACTNLVAIFLPVSKSKRWPAASTKILWLALFGFKIGVPVPSVVTIIFL